MARVSVYRESHFNAAHRLNNPELSEERNRELFGKCNSANYHGHNYKIIVKLVGEINPETGYVFDLKILSDIIASKIEDRFDHKNLNLDTAEFKNLNPTAENIAVVCYNILRKEIPDHLDLFVRLYETDRNFVEYPV